MKKPEEKPCHPKLTEAEYNIDPLKIKAQQEECRSEGRQRKASQRRIIKDLVMSALRFCAMPMGNITELS
jgi:hypothetical protein